MQIYPAMQKATVKSRETVFTYKDLKIRFFYKSHV